LTVRHRSQSKHLRHFLHDDRRADVIIALAGDARVEEADRLARLYPTPRRFSTIRTQCPARFDQLGGGDRSRIELETHSQQDARFQS
jgi:hypothetical protein